MKVVVLSLWIALLLSIAIELAPLLFPAFLILAGIKAMSIALR